ncbi:ribbon-helix-helix protein, CopG family [Pyrolobus fumarii]|nr:ribbon-helix-helix protein, CopG family [Pyrolobus fumarii]
MLRIVTFKVDEALLEALDRYAKMKRMSRSEAIREAIKRLLESEGIAIRPVRRREVRSDKIEFEIII